MKPLHAVDAFYKTRLLSEKIPHKDTDAIIQAVRKDIKMQDCKADPSRVAEVACCEDN